MEGWIKLHRKIKDSKVFANPEILKLWTLCLCKANHSHTWIHLDGVSDPIEVQPGQFITGRYSLHREYYQTESESNKSPLTVWRWLEKLSRWNNVNIKTNNKYSLVEIVNWEFYQSLNSSEQENEHQLNNKRTTDEQQMNTDKNDKNEENDKILDQQIAQIYEIYPRKVGKKKALQSIRKALKEVEFDELFDRVRIFSECVNGQESKYIPYPSTWFNQGRWEDDPEEWNAWKQNANGKSPNDNPTPQYLTNRL